MRIADVAESFPPDVNGVAFTAIRITEQLASSRHKPLVFGPEPARSACCLDDCVGYPVVRAHAVGLPLYPGQGRWRGGRCRSTP